MNSQLSSRARIVQEYLSQRGFPFEVQELSTSTRTAQEAADSIGCRVGQIAKSLIFKDANTDKAVLIIASGANRVNLAKVEHTAGLKLEKADGKFIKEKVGFPIGGVPPVAHKEPLQTFLDQELQQYDVIWAAAGTPFAVFKLTPGDLEELTGGCWINLAE